MVDNNSIHSIIFRGNLQPGQKIEQVKQRLVKLFKADEQQIERLFQGGSVTLEKSLTPEKAQAYQLMMKKVGLVTTIKPPVRLSSTKKATNTAADTPIRDSKPENNDSKKIDSSDKESSLASGLSLAPMEGYLLKESEREKSHPVMVDDHSGEWTLSPLGEDLLSRAEKTDWQTKEIDTSSLTLMELENPVQPEI